MEHRLWQSTLHLLIFGFIAKILATLAKIITTRLIGATAIGYFSLVSPLMLVVISFAQLGLPTAVSKLVSSNPLHKKTLVITAFIMISGASFGIMFLLLITAPWIANMLFQNPHTLPTLYALAFLAPLVGTSGLLRGYLVGIGRVESSAHSQISEEIGRLLFIMMMTPLLISEGDDWASAIAMTSLLIGEVVQILHLSISLFFKSKVLSLKFSGLFKLMEKESFNQLLNIALPLTTGRLIGSFTYFLEPIILTIGLTRLGYSSHYISTQYGILVSYAMPLLLMPGFFAGSFATVLLPSLSRSFSLGHIQHSRKLFIYFVLASGLIGLSFALISFIFPETLLTFLYGTTQGAEEVRFIAFPFVFYYIEAPINSAMYALGLDKLAFRNSLVANGVRLLAEAIFISNFQIISVAISTILSVIVIVCLNFLSIFPVLFRNNQPTVQKF